jgi:hypothetical protein
MLTNTKWVAIAILQQIVFAQTVALPRIDINTDDGKQITSKVEWVSMTFSLTDPSNPQNNIPAISNQQIRGRGNSSWNASWNIIRPADGINTYRNPYRIRFKKEQQQSPFGLSAARNWALINADIDKNAFGLEMGKRLDLQYTCSYNPVEVYVNNGNSGKYILTEHRQADPAYIGAPGRPKVHLTEGWFVEMDRYYPENEPVKFHTESYNLPVIVKSPEFEDADSLDPRYDFVKNDLNRIANLMASNDFPENGYRDLIDAESFIKYFLVQTFMQNVDIFRKGTETGDHIGSAFFYKDKGGKIGAGPLWDLNWSFQEFSGMQAAQTGNMGPNLYPYMVHPWLARFFDDPVFLVRYIEIWNEKMPQVESMRGFIDEIEKKINGTGTTVTQTINTLTSFYDRRLTFLKTEYSKVNVRPLTQNFGTEGYNYLQVPSRAVTLVSYGEMSSLSATLKKGTSSDFEIISNLNQTSTGKGGYLATVSVKPKNSLAIASYRDTLVLNGAKQGSEFTFKVPLNFVVSEKESTTFSPQIASGNKVIPIRNGINLTVATNAAIRIYNALGMEVASYTFAGGVYNISLNHLPHGIYVAKVSSGREHKTMRVAVR